jgi:hypothetical protein
VIGSLVLRVQRSGKTTICRVRAASDASRFRPVGWWLKEADHRLEGAFDRCLQEVGLPSRRAWQVLASVARGPADQAELAAELSSFDSVEDLQLLLRQMQDQDWLLEREGVVELTPAGTEMHQAAAGAVDQIRTQFAEALPGEDYRILIGLLGSLVDAFPSAAQATVVKLAIIAMSSCSRLWQ